MESAAAVDLCRTALMSALIIGAPMLIVAMLAGLVIGLVQALTQVQDQTVAFVPKLLAMIAAMIVCMPWILTRMMEYTRIMFENAGTP